MEEWDSVWFDIRSAMAVFIFTPLIFVIGAGILPDLVNDIISVFMGIWTISFLYLMFVSILVS